MRATRGDGATGVTGQLCRSEYMDLLIRFCHATLDNIPGAFVSDHLEDYLKKKLEPIYRDSEILKLRKQFQSSKLLNCFLFDNRVGLRKLFNEKKIKKKFTYNSALKLFKTCIPADKLEQGEDGQPGGSLVHVKKCFVFSKMTNILDNQKPQKYLSLEYVEFLEMICRFSVCFVQDRAGEEHVSELVEEMVEEVVQIMWEARIKAPRKKRRRKKVEFPELVPLPDFVSD